MGRWIDDGPADQPDSQLVSHPNAIESIAGKVLSNSAGQPHKSFFLPPWTWKYFLEPTTRKSFLLLRVPFLDLVQQSLSSYQHRQTDTPSVSLIQSELPAEAAEKMRVFILAMSLALLAASAAAEPRRSRKNHVEAGLKALAANKTEAQRQGKGKAKE